MWLVNVHVHCCEHYKATWSINTHNEGFGWVRNPENTAIEWDPENTARRLARVTNLKTHLEEARSRVRILKSALLWHRLLAEWKLLIEDQVQGCRWNVPEILFDNDLKLFVSFVSLIITIIIVILSKYHYQPSLFCADTYPKDMVGRPLVEVRRNPSHSTLPWNPHISLSYHHHVSSHLVQSIHWEH